MFAVCAARPGTIALKRLTLGGLSAAAGSLLLPQGLALAEEYGESEDVFEYVVNQFAKPISLDRFRGQVANVNYPSLRSLVEKYSGDGFTIIGFPCNQFGGQAPGTSDEERRYAYHKFGFEFPVMDKIDVNGPAAAPLYKMMRRVQPVSQPTSGKVAPLPGEPGRIEWNYVKFLVDRFGRPVKRFKPQYDPMDFEDDIRLLLAGKPALPPECVLHPGRKVCKVELSSAV
ncbi:hypothetical protein WJX72_004289 [[Myrmecia] bisecta]|uniref:Glutathione peroxidase n=1 Tax=[Myrmecia] bisecta TaxID=41462 RepID=A0AAW1Q066_9CHLO